VGGVVVYVYFVFRKCDVYFKRVIFLKNITTPSIQKHIQKGLQPAFYEEENE
jgi:hypothetical protein